MPLPKQKFREMVLQMLYSFEIGQESEDVLIPLIMEEVKVSKKNAKEAYDKTVAIWCLKAFLDEKIQRVSTEYALERIQSIDHTILRLGVYELFFDSTLTGAIAIAEGMRLARKYSSLEAGSFINALLDTILKQKNDLPCERAVC